MKEQALKYRLNCAKEEIGIWLNVQTLCLLLVCVTSALAAAAIITVSVMCDASFHLTIVNGSLSCADQAHQYSVGGQLDITNKESSANKISDDDDPNSNLGVLMRIALVLLVVAIIIVVTAISMHRVIVRERDKRLCGELSKLMVKNQVNTEGTQVFGSQLLPVENDESIIINV